MGTQINELIECMMCRDAPAVATIIEHGFKKGSDEIDVCRQCMAKHTSFMWRKYESFPLYNDEIRLSAELTDLEMIHKAIYYHPSQFCGRCGMLMFKEGGCSNIICSRCGTNAKFIGYTNYQRPTRPFSQNVNDVLTVRDLLRALLDIVFVFILILQVICAGFIIINWFFDRSDIPLDLSSAFFGINNNREDVQMAVFLHGTFHGWIQIFMISDIIWQWTTFRHESYYYYGYIFSLFIISLIFLYSFQYGGPPSMSFIFPIIEHGLLFHPKISQLVYHPE